LTRLKWSDEEIELLKNNYEHESLDSIQEMLPRFELHKIRQKASKLGLKRKAKRNYSKGYKVKRWTSDEVALLKQLYPYNTNEFIQSKINRFSTKEIRRKANSLNLNKLDDVKALEKEQLQNKLHGERKWTDEEVDLLINNYEQLGSKGMVKLLTNRTSTMISSKAAKLGLKTDQEARWKAVDSSVNDDFSVEIVFERIDR